MDENRQKDKVRHFGERYSKIGPSPTMILTNPYKEELSPTPKQSNNQMKRCAKGLHTFKELPRTTKGQNISSPIWRCACGVLESTRELDPNFNNEK